VSQWAVAEFVSRVAERVTTVSEDLAAQWSDRDWSEDHAAGPLAVAFPPVEPSPDFVASLRQQLAERPLPAAAVLPEQSAVWVNRGVVYGLAAVGSLASAAVVVVVLRNRSNRCAA
jgi:hypothetical protein